MPIVFEQIDTEIAPDRGADAPTPEAGGGGAQQPGDGASAVRRELAMIDERRQRLAAD